MHVLRPCYTVQFFLQLATLFYSCMVDVKLANTRLHRVTGPLAHDVVLNHTFELLINTTMLY